MSQEMVSSTSSLSDGSDDEDDEGGGWLSQAKFDLKPPPVSARNHSTTRRPLSHGEFEVRLWIKIPSSLSLTN